jgi:hypothetical protein
MEEALAGISAVNADYAKQCGACARGRGRNVRRPESPGRDAGASRVRILHLGPLWVPVSLDAAGGRETWLAGLKFYAVPAYPFINL